MTDDRQDREYGGGSLWRIERIEERQKDILHHLDILISQTSANIQRGEERGWKIDAILAEIQRGLKEVREIVDKRGMLDNSAIIKILVLGLLAATGANIGVKALIGG